MGSLRRVLVVVAAISLVGCGGDIPDLSFSDIGTSVLTCTGKAKRNFSGTYEGTTLALSAESSQTFPVTLELRQAGSTVNGFVEVTGCVDRLPLEGKVVETCLEASGERPGEKVVIRYSAIGLWSVDVFAGQSKCARAWRDPVVLFTKVE